jgi:hypothetical protein
VARFCDGGQAPQQPLYTVFLLLLVRFVVDRAAFEQLGERASEEAMSRRQAPSSSRYSSISRLASMPERDRYRPTVSIRY